MRQRNGNCSATYHFKRLFISKPLEFLIYCIEEYKRIHGTQGLETYDLFDRSGAARYIIDHYEALHTAGIEYTLNDISGMLQQG